MRAHIQLSLLASLLVVTACDGDGTENVATKRVFMANESSLATHLLTDNEDFSSSNRVEPGATRTRNVSYRTDSEDPMLVFRAGRSGVVFATVSCSSNAPGREYIISFLADGTMICP